MSIFGCIEAGGTKFVCGVGTGPDDLRLATFPTLSPAETLDKIVAFFRAEAGSRLSAVGIGSFGPVDLRPESPTFGYITSTPKPGWQYYDLAGQRGARAASAGRVRYRRECGGVGEARWGAARGISDFIYLTVGTGIGGGAIVQRGSRPRAGASGDGAHSRPARPCRQDPYPGLCPYHRDCLEGLAAGPTMQARWGMPARELPADHAGWELEAHYLALGLAAWVCTLSPERIVSAAASCSSNICSPWCGGSWCCFLNGYIRASALRMGSTQYVVPPQLGNRAGVLGAIVLAENAYRNATPACGRWHEWRSTRRW